MSGNFTCADSDVLLMSLRKGSLKMKNLKIRLALLLGGTAPLVIPGTQVFPQELPKGITQEDLANNNRLFLELARRASSGRSLPSRSGSPAQYTSSAPRDSGPF
jgi:hypothetical protein